MDRGVSGELRAGGALSACLAVACGGAAPGGSARPSIEPAKLVDLTHRLHPEMAYWPGGEPFVMTRLVDYDAGYRLHKFEFGENTGTHLDAPLHFAPGKRDVSAIPLGELVVPAVVIDVRSRVAADPAYRLGADAVRAWEAEHGTIPAGVLVILNTGWHARFADPTAYANQDAEVMRFPGYGVDAAELLIERRVVGIGVDTLSIDHGPSADFPVHKLVLGAGLYMLENLANLDALPATGAIVVVGVLPIADGTQAQGRVFAILP